MTKRYRIELTAAELRALDDLALAGADELPDDPHERAAARRALRKLSAAVASADVPRDSATWQPHPAMLDGSHDPERADCACDWCAEGHAPSGQLAMDDVSRPGLPMDWREQRDDRERASLGLPTLDGTRRMFDALDGKERR